MNHDTAITLMRLDRLEKSARGYQERARLSGNMRRHARAARLEVAAHSKAMAIVMGEVASYRD